MRTQEQITQEFRESLTRARALWDELLACVKAKPADPEEPKYRDVTEADIGKEVDVSDYHDFSEIRKGTLGMISNIGNFYLKDGIPYDYARIRITPEIPQQFKVGDWVVCREIPKNQDEPPVFTDYMIHYVGLAGQVCQARSTSCHVEFSNDDFWDYRNEWLSPATPDEIAASVKIIVDGSSG
jgi:hypothetical protein